MNFSLLTPVEEQERFCVGLCIIDIPAVRIKLDSYFLFQEDQSPKKLFDFKS